MDPILGTAAIGAAGDVANIISTAITNKSQRKYAEQMWNKTNAYNSPIEQRKRMEQAGFNPNMMYGHGTVSNTASQQSVPEQIAPKTNLGSIAEASQRLGADLSLKREQSENANIQNEYWNAMTLKTKNDAFLSTIRALEGMTDIERKQFDNSKLGEMFKANLDALGEKTRLTGLQADNVAITNDIAKVNLAYLPQEKERSARMDLTRIANIAKDTQLKGSLMKLQSLSGDKLVQEISSLRTTQAGAELDNVVKKLKAWKSTYGLSDSAFSDVVGTVLGISGSLLEDLGLIDKGSRINSKR